MVKDKNVVTETGKIDFEAILNSARASFIGKDKNLGLQITSGAHISRPTKDSDFVLYRATHWEKLTGIRGIPFGRVVQIAGRPDSGKSSHAMALMKEAQDQNVVVILWDTENKFSARRFDNFFGGNSATILFVPSRMIYQGGDQVEALVHAVMENVPNAKVLITWDSVGGALPMGEAEDKNFRDTTQMAQAAKENGKVVRGFVRLMETYKNQETNEERIAVLLINQSYSNIGAPGQKESGGQKVEYYSSLILQLTRKKDLTKVKKGVKHKIGIVTRAKVKKNHLFDGEDSVAELDLLVTAGGIRLASEAKLKTDGDWEDDDGEVEEVDE